MGEHRLHMAAQGLDAGGGHLMTQELDNGGGEHALLCVDDQARLAQPRENFSQMLQMLLFVSAGYDDVVQVAEDEGEARQDAIHHPLEGVARSRKIQHVGQRIGVRLCDQVEAEEVSARPP